MIDETKFVSSRRTVCLRVFLTVLAFGWCFPPSVNGDEKSENAKLQGELHAALKAANPEYQNGGSFTIKEGKLIGINLMRCKGITDLSPLTNFSLSSVATVSLYNATNIVDISPLKECQLTQLNLERCSKIHDLSPLKGMPLRWFRMYACSSVADLSPLAGMPLDHLDIGLNSLIDDISVIRGMPIHDLRIDNCPKIEDISAIEKMPLTFLSLFNDKGVKDFSPLATLELETLYFSPELLSSADIEALRKMKSLKKLARSWDEYRKEMSPAEFWKRFDAGEFQARKKK